jgi:hypothetical protein
MIAVMGFVSQLVDVANFALLVVCVNVDEILDRTSQVQKDGNNYAQTDIKISQNVN